MLGFDAVVPRHGEQPLGEVVLTDLNLKVVGKGIKQQLALDLGFGRSASLGFELVTRRALLGEQLIELGLVVINALDGVLQDTVVLSLHDRLGQRHVDLVEKRIGGGRENLLGLLGTLGGPNLLAELGAQFVDGVEFAGELSELVIGGVQFTFLHRLDGDSDFGVAADVFTGRKLGGEHLRLVDRQPDQGLVEADDQAAGADLVRQSLGSCVGDVLAVNGRRQVDRDEVAVLDRAIHAYQGAEPGAQRLQLGLDVVIADLDGIDGDLQRAQIGQGDLGTHVDLSGEGQVLAVFLVGHLDLGLPQWVQLGLGDRLAVAARQRFIDDLIEDHIATNPGLEETGRRFTRPKAGHPDLLGQLFIGLLEI